MTDTALTLTVTADEALVIWTSLHQELNILRSTIDDGWLTREQSHLDAISDLASRVFAAYREVSQ